MKSEKLAELSFRIQYGDYSVGNCKVAAAVFDAVQRNGGRISCASVLQVVSKRVVLREFCLYCRKNDGVVADNVCNNALFACLVKNYLALCDVDSLADVADADVGNSADRDSKQQVDVVIEAALEI